MKTRMMLAPALLALAVAAPHAQDISQTEIRVSRPAVRIFQGYTLKQGEAVEQVVVIGGDATIAGRVDRDVVVILGRAELAPTAEIEGSFVVVGGTGVIADGAKVHEDVVVLGGLEEPAGFAPGGDHVAIGTTALGTRLQGLLRWVTQGLLFGRLIVPSLGWVWIVAAVFFFLNLLLNVLFDAPVGACASTLRDTPASAFVTGLLAMLFVAPLCLLLAVSVIGIAIIPFLIGALVLATIIGRIGFARWLGMGIVHQDDLENRRQSLRSFVIGSAVMCIAYMIPVIGVLAWAMATVFGLGAALQAFARAYRKEHPRPPRAARLAPAAPVVAPSGEAAASASLAMPSAAPPDAVVAPGVPAPEAAAGTPRATDLLSFPRASFLERLAAFALDFVLVVFAAQIVRFDRLLDVGGAFPGNLLLVALVYHVGFWAWKQTTVGGIVCQLRLVKTDGSPVQFAEALIRGLSGIFSLLVVGIGFLWVLWDSERQSWHDRIAGTYVVKVPRSWPI
jgi:uncharacterized RDD family membrane protein YckC